MADRSPSPPTALRDHRRLAWSDYLVGYVADRAVVWLEEDLGHECDWTSVALVSAGATAVLDVVARRGGVIAGLPAAAVVAGVTDPRLEWQPLTEDGQAVAAGAVVARLAGPTRSVLTAERTLLNVLGRMSGVATATRRLVDAVAGTPCRVYDTRKTVPGLRLLDKYAARAGGGWTHRLGLYDAILIKDNHLAAVASAGGDPATAARQARQFIGATFSAQRAAEMVVEIELDSLHHLPAVLAAEPDIILLDNMPTAMLAEGVAIRNRLKSRVILEASGGISVETVAAIAATGIDRVSSGWPTHGAPWLDIALDWEEARRG
ncbi:MAG: carboxylating nicotinate-nucleotide diphosphorylase [Planctomycetota bacterium]|nr:MAG: carboxylating nicotinate-nucleotide diphosphorylase [Planctomycetota bacterium]